jgi:transglutaminase-like putative cysteine protease
MDEYLRPTPFIDRDSPEVVGFAREAAGDAGSDVDRAVRLFYAVRDRIRYDPYSFRITPDIFRASAVAVSEASFCVPKAILLAAAARAVGIPSRLGFADVRNHLTTKRLQELMGTDVFVFHGFTELWLGGKWVKATPTFDRALCDRFGVQPLEFDGRTDSLFHPFDRTGRRHMEYLRYRGSFADFPMDAMMEALRAAYPIVFGSAALIEGDFAREAEEAEEP